MGVAAVDALLDNQSAAMIGIVNDEIMYVPLNKSVKLHKKISRDLIDLAEGICTFGPGRK